MSENESSRLLRVAIVGPCAAGKSTLASGLEAAGYETHHPAQEHSYVPDMWQRRVQPDVLIYLDVDHTHVKARRPQSDSPPQRVAEQRERLAHARQHCDLYVDTNDLTPTQVLTQTLVFLQKEEKTKPPHEQQ